jgi:predicted SAM-dependent methyltransferase
MMTKASEGLSNSAPQPDFFEARIQPLTKKFLTTGKRRQVYVWDLIRMGTLAVWPYYWLRAGMGKYAGARINVAAGASRLPGWLNIDANPLRSPHIWADMRNRWPFRNASIAAIVTSHFLEHLFDNELDRVLREMYRVLRPGSYLRISVPSLDKAVAQYVNATDGTELAERGQRFQLTCHWYGAHHQVFDFERLRGLLAGVGFKDLQQPPFPQSGFCSLAEVIEIDRHPDESLFIECQKPSTLVSKQAFQSSCGKLR